MLSDFRLTAIPNGIPCILLCAVLAFFPGCRKGSRASRHGEAQPVAFEQMPTSEYDLIATHDQIKTLAAAARDQAVLEFIGCGSFGQEGRFSDTSWGEYVSVTVGEVYLSALGIPCRRATILNENMLPATVVAMANANGTWSLAPDISLDFGSI
ncbi:MAG: hypothetical protein LIP23_02020 [Planctomycetes bacterium]|nr:hypothetical protein [Planctomycetota bacterium]